MTKAEKEAIRKLRNAYQREYYAKNKERVRQYQENYWLRKAREMLEAEAAGQSEADANKVVRFG